MTDQVEATSKKTLTTEDATSVVDEIIEAQNQSYALGLKLKLPEYEVSRIRSMYRDPRDQLLQVIIEFTKQVTPRPTWTAIVDALKSPSVHLPHLAERIETKHCLVPTSSPVVQPETQDTGINVEQEITSLRRDFRDLKNATCMAVEEKGIGVTELIDEIVDLPAVEEQDDDFFMKRADDIRKSEIVPAVFDRLHRHWDYLHPDIYGHLIAEFSLTDVSPKLTKYQRKLDLFLDRTLLTDFCRVEGRRMRLVTPPANFALLVTKHFRLCPPPVYLRDVEVFRREFADFCGLKSCAVMVVGILEGSVIITMLVPESIESTIRFLDPEFIRVHNITHIMLNDLTVYPQEASVSRLTTTSEKAAIQPFSITTAVGTVYVLIGLWENAAALGDDSDKHASTNAATTATPHTDLSEGRLRGYK